MQSSLSFLAMRIKSRGSLSLRNIFLPKKSIWKPFWISFALLLGSQCNAANITVSVSDTQLQSDFIAFTTAQFVAKIESGLFGPKITLTGKNSGYIPPIISSPIATPTVLNECTGFGAQIGMEYERADDLRLIKAFKDDLLAKGNCGGIVSASTVPVQAYRDGCFVAYNIIISTISQKTDFSVPGL